MHLSYYVPTSHHLNFNFFSYPSKQDGQQIKKNTKKITDLVQLGYIDYECLSSFVVTIWSVSPHHFVILGLKYFKGVNNECFADTVINPQTFVTEIQVTFHDI